MMNDPCRVRVTGPLAVYAAGFRDELRARGYAPGSAAMQLQLAGELSRWLEGQGLDVGDLTSARVEAFFAFRRERVRRLFVSPRALRVLLEHLDGVGVLPAAEPVPSTPIDRLVERYARYPCDERALAGGTVRRCVYVARRFLSGCSPDGDLEGVDASAVIAFVRAECEGHTAGWGKGVATVVRSLLGFLHREELITVPLAQAVPAPAGWKAASLPEALTAAQVMALLAAYDRRTPAGRRDFAVVLLTTRLGLRAGEIAAVELGDVDWVHGTLRVRGKGRRVDLLPLPADVGRALADYVRHARRRVGGASLFRRIGAPHSRLAPTTVTGIVYRACDRAGLSRVGAHRLRHTAATLMLGGGASLPEIAQVLRHRSPTTTAIYAKVDRRALSGLARPWPGGVA
jgi:site-specific recombinase XerD